MLYCTVYERYSQTHVVQVPIHEGAAMVNVKQTSSHETLT